jgi:hypothetical protein
VKNIENFPIFSTYSNILWGMWILLVFIVGIYYLKLWYERGKKGESKILLSFAFIFFGGGLTKFFHLFGDLYLLGEYFNHEFYGNYGIINITYEILSKFGYVSTSLGALAFYYTADKILGKIRHFFTIFMVLTVILVIILPYKSAQAFNYYASIVSIIGFVTALLILTIKSENELQSISLIMLVGYAIYSFGNMFDTARGKELGIMPLTIPPLIVILGSFIILLPTFISSDYLKKPYIFWIISSLSYLILDIVTLIFILLLEAPLSYIIFYWLLLMIFGLISSYLIFNTFKVKRAKGTEKKAELSDILKTFSKPEKLTEEEISVAKEKQICLVCKNKLGGNIFLCSSCGAFYCVKCSDTLATLENACWVCDIPFDETKPVRLPEREEKEIEVEPSKRGEGK